MGLFSRKKQVHKKSPSEKAADGEQYFFDEYLREELRTHAQWYFEKIIKDNGEAFAQELTTVTADIKTGLQESISAQLEDAVQQVSTDLKVYITKSLDAQVTDYSRAIKEAQDLALQSLNRSAQVLQGQYQKLSLSLQQTITDQETLLSNASQENIDRLAHMRETQHAAAESLARSAEALEKHYQEMSHELDKRVAEQEARLVETFKENLAQIVEQYIVEAVGDQYNLKEQLPTIIAQLEEKKQAIVDDIRL